MPSICNDPREFVVVKQIPSSSHVGLKITARCSTPVYICEEPSRKEVARENFERRKFQITNCGYRSINYKPYKSIGDVVLDDKELILKSLGQLNDPENEHVADDMSDASSVESEKASNGGMVEEAKVTIKNPKIENLHSLQEHLQRWRYKMNKVKMGISLFKIAKEEHEKKVVQAEKDRMAEEENIRNAMKPPNENESAQYADEICDLSRYLAPTSTRPLPSEDSCENQNCVKADVDTQDSIVELNSEENSLESDEKKRLVISRWQNLGSMVLNLPIETLEGAGRDNKLSMHQMQSSKAEKNNNDRNSYAKYGENKISNADDKSIQEPIAESPNMNAKDAMISFREKKPSTVRSRIVNSKKYQREVPRPFSPLFTNINFYETESREYIFRQLCVIHWILEAMSQDKQPAMMPSISTCWKLKGLKDDLHKMQQKVERDKAVDPIWKAFLNNPGKFSRGRTGRRNTLLQRRVSVAPSALRMLSISSQSTSSVALKTKSSLSADGLNNDLALHNDKTREYMRSRGSSHTVTFSKSSEIISDDEDLSEKKISIQSKISVQQNVMETSQVAVPYQSPKEKAYTVRDVFIAKNAFNRRDSKMIRSKSAFANAQGRRCSTKPGSESLTEDTTFDHSQETYNSKRKAWTQKNGPVMKAKVLAAAISSFGAITQNMQAEKIPVKSKEKFEELTEESALVLHDNLEQRERTNIKSMEKKFFALHAMSDVHKAINVMRLKGRLKVETDEEKKARFSEECSWYKNLLDNLPAAIREDRNNALVLDKIAKYGSLEGRKLSSVRFLKVLSLLRPWELCSPDISAGIEFVRDKVVEMGMREFEEWFNSRIAKETK